MSTVSKIVTGIAFDMERGHKHSPDDAEQLRVWQEWRAFKEQCDAIDRRQRLKRGVWLGLAALGTLIAAGM